ncbi:MAG: hypothetical protein NTV00_14210 [Methylococcales bacterium]|nr:hypothetical protein [Methylococcales bacterium]
MNTNVLKYVGIDKNLGAILLMGVALSLLGSWGVEVLLASLFSVS